jgi:hypothetical protein
MCHPVGVPARMYFRQFPHAVGAIKTSIERAFVQEHASKGLAETARAASWTRSRNA